MTEGEAKKHIESNPTIAEFADFGDGVDAKWVARAERELGLTLPPSYKWWLLNYGGGEIGGEEVFSIYEQDFDTVVGGDVVCMHRLNQRDGVLGPRQLAICASDIDGLFYFDFDRQRDDGECPVISAATGKEYASNFSEFLVRRVETAA